MKKFILVYSLFVISTSSLAMAESKKTLTCDLVAYSQSQGRVSEDFVLKEKISAEVASLASLRQAAGATVGCEESVIENIKITFCVRETIYTGVYDVSTLLSEKNKFALGQIKTLLGTRQNSEVVGILRSNLALSPSAGNELADQDIYIGASIDNIRDREFKSAVAEAYKRNLLIENQIVVYGLNNCVLTQK